MPFAAGQLLMSPRSARMVQRYGAKAVGATGMFVMAAAIAGYATLGTASPIWLLGVLFGIQGAAIGVSMPAATAAVMDVLPRERAGAGSALTNTARQVAVALSVAILGSILAEFYRSSLSPTLAGLPAAARSAASSSITATQAVAQQLGTSGRSLLGPANDAFVHSMRITTLIAAVLALAGGFVVLRWMPGKPRKAAQASAALASDDPAYEAELAILESSTCSKAQTERGDHPMQPVILDQGPGTDAEAGPAETTRRPGRPRSEQAEQAIIEATLDLFAEQGFEGVCVEAVAARAGVGKATIYRRWPNKEELLLAALGSMKSPFPEPTGSVRDDLVAQLTVMCADRADPRKARRYALLLGEGQKYPRLMARYKETVVEPRHDAIREVIRRGIATGELRADTDVEIALLALTGTVLAKEKAADGVAERRIRRPHRGRTAARPGRPLTAGPRTSSTSGADLLGQEPDESLEVGVALGGVDRDVGRPGPGVLADRGGDGRGRAVSRDADEDHDVGRAAASARPRSGREGGRPTARTSSGLTPPGMITPSASSPASETVRGRIPPTSSGGTTAGGQSRATWSRWT